MKENINLPMFYGASIEIFRRAELLRNHMTETENLLDNQEELISTPIKVNFDLTVLFFINKHFE